MRFQFFPPLQGPLVALLLVSIAYCLPTTGNDSDATVSSPLGKTTVHSVLTGHEDDSMSPARENPFKIQPPENWRDIITKWVAEGVELSAQVKDGKHGDEVRKQILMLKMQAEFVQVDLDTQIRNRYNEPKAQC